MSLIDRYVAEVGRRLPLFKGRKDIEKELHSTLQDMLEDRAQKSGRPADEALEIELLKEYGSPDKVAATYNPTPYLIGPRLFPFFVMVLKIVLAVLVVVLLVTTGVQLATHSPVAPLEFLGMLGQGLLGIVSAAISAFGNIALVFAILERFVPAVDFGKEQEQEWDPASLKKEPEPDEVKPWEPIAGIAFTFIVFSIFNFYPQLISFYTFTGDHWVGFPLLSPAFFRWMPLINVAWIAEIILNGILLRTGRWQVSTRWFSVAIQFLQLGIAYLLLSGPSILAITPQALQATGIFDPDTAQTLGSLAQQGVRASIALIMVLMGVNLVKTAYRLARAK